MKLAIVAGGWHFPEDFYYSARRMYPDADLFVITHRSPDLPIVREEKRHALRALKGPLAELDRILYRDYATRNTLSRWGWKVTAAPNTCGDWGFFNQWLEAFPNPGYYDAILNCHDDTLLREPVPAEILEGKWLMLAHGRYPQAPRGYVRGSFEFWRPELLRMLGDRIDLGDVALTREGLTDSPAGLEALSAWNDTAVPLRHFMRKRGLLDRIEYLSEYYRISRYAIEGERGLLSNKGGAPWSFDAGCSALL
jgi:hypothetical protein